MLREARRRPLGAGATGRCGQPDVGAGTELRLSVRAVSPLPVPCSVLDDHLSYSSQPPKLKIGVDRLRSLLFGYVPIHIATVSHLHSSEQQSLRTS